MADWNLRAILQWPYLPYVVGGVVVIATLPKLAKRVMFKMMSSFGHRPVDPSTFPKDKVTLFQIPRGPYAPNMSPFPLKLETYLRMANIPYENNYKNPMSPKGKTPWMVYDGKVISDSQFCLEFLNDHRGVDLNSQLSAEQRAVARAMQVMVEEHLYWALVLWRWKYCWDIPGASGVMKIAFEGMNTFLLGQVGEYVQNMAHGQGMGRHTKDEVLEIAHKDIRALSTFLGEKSYFMGDEPCEADCAIFGMVAQFYWQMPASPMKDLIDGECKNLGDYCERMKSRFWPDWDQCITHGGTKKATG